MNEGNAGGSEQESRRGDLAYNFQKEIAPVNTEKTSATEKEQKKPQHENPIVARILEEVDAQIENISRKRNNRRDKRALRPKHYVRSST
jgi:hypothetical protein